MWVCQEVTADDTTDTSWACHYVWVVHTLMRHQASPTAPIMSNSHPMTNSHLMVPCKHCPLMDTMGSTNRL